MANDGNTFSISTVKHPIFWVDDLDDAASWFERVFGVPTTTTRQLMHYVEEREGYGLDYGIFHLVQDTFIESIDPDRLVIGGTTSFPLRGIPPIATPMLGHFGWYLDDASALFATLQERGMQCQNQVGEITSEMAFGGKVGYPSFYVLREDAGLAYQFVECWPGEENAARTGDARLAPGWKLTPPPEEDDLGIEFCSHHTVVTQRPERVLTLFVDVLGGRVLHEGPNDVLGSHSTYVALGDGVFECAVPAAGGLTVAGALNPEPYDSYHSMTFLVRELERAEAHLQRQGVRVARRTDTAIVTDPATSYGVPWGFTTSLTPGDVRTV